MVKGIQLGGWRIELGQKPTDAVQANQVHGSAIAMAETVASNETEADGIFINKPDIKASVGFADCMPLVLAGQGKAVILHVSRKTLVAGLLDHVPHFLNPKDIKYVFVGPHICEQHFTFEWEGKGIAAFKQKFPGAAEGSGGTIHLSLRAAMQTYFNEWGISQEKITEDGRCTYETPELPSWRRHREQGGTADTLSSSTATLQQT